MQAIKPGRSWKLGHSVLQEASREGRNYGLKVRPGPGCQRGRELHQISSAWIGKPVQLKLIIGQTTETEREEIGWRQWICAGQDLLPIRSTVSVRIWVIRIGMIYEHFHLI